VCLATAASDLGGDALTCTWNFGDGSSGTGSSPNHIYAASGTYVVTVTAKDGNGGSTATTMVVRINRQVEVAKASVKLNFQKLNSDVIAVSGTVQLPSLFAGG